MLDSTPRGDPHRSNDADRRFTPSLHGWARRDPRGHRSRRRPDRHPGPDPPQALAAAPRARRVRRRSQALIQRESVRAFRGGDGGDDLRLQIRQSLQLSRRRHRGRDRCAPWGEAGERDPRRRVQRDPPGRRQDVPPGRTKSRRRRTDLRGRLRIRLGCPRRVDHPAAPPRLHAGRRRNGARHARSPSQRRLRLPLHAQQSHRHRRQPHRGPAAARRRPGDMCRC